jgi:hypothetical protein
LIGKGGGVILGPAMSTPNASALAAPRTPVTLFYSYAHERTS